MSITKLKTLFELIQNQICKQINTKWEVLLFVLLICIKSAFFNKMIAVFYTHSMFLTSSLGTALFAASFSLWLQRKARIRLLITLDLILSVFMIADVVYFRYFNDVISVPVLRQVVLMDTLKSSISNLFRISDVLFIIDIIVISPVYFLAARTGRIISKDTFRKRAITATAVLLIGICGISYGFLEIYKSMGSRIFTFVLDRTYFVQNVGILNFHGFDIYSALVKGLSRGQGISSEKKEEILETFKNLEQSQDERLFGAAKGCNLIVLQAEAFQNMLIDMKINGKEVTPNLNKFVKRSAYFSNYFSQAAQGSTSDAEFLSNVSYYPLTEGSVYFRYPNNTFDTLPKAMKEIGYKTVAMHAYKGSYWNRSAIYPVIGFDKFYNMPDYIFDERVGWGLSDKSFFKQSVDKLKTIESPFYAFMISLSAHYPYDAFDSSADFNVSPYDHTFLGNYLKAQYYADEALGALFEELENSGLMENSVIVIYGDHAGIQKEKTEEYKDFLNLNDNIDLRWMQMMKVPLIIHFPEDKEAGTRDTAGGQIDLYPTIANLYGIKPRYSLGKDLFNTEDGYAIFRNGNVTNGKIAYVKALDTCYDLFSGEKVDAGEFKGKIDFASKQLEISDDVISSNLIKYFIKAE